MRSLVPSLALALLITTPPSWGGIVDDAVAADRWFLALEDTGRLWYHEIDCRVDDWRDLGIITGARAVDATGEFGVILGTGELILGYFRLNSVDQRFEEDERVAIPDSLPPLVDVLIGAPGVVACLTEDGHFYSLRPVEPRWHGPCSLPPVPVSVRDASWGKSKAEFRLDGR